MHEVRVDVGLEPNSAVVILCGIVDLRVRPQLSAAASLLVLGRPRAVCVDLSAVTYFGVDGLRLLANLARGASPACEVTVANPSPMARRALEVTGFMRTLRVSGEPRESFRVVVRPTDPVVSVVLGTEVAQVLAMASAGRGAVRPCCNVRDTDGFCA